MRHSGIGIVKAGEIYDALVVIAGVWQAKALGVTVRMQALLS